MSNLRSYTLLRVKQLAAVLVLALLGLTGLLMIEVEGRLRDLATASTDNLQWNIAQLEVELLRLEGQIAATEQVVLTTSPQPEQASSEASELAVSLRTLRTRFDIFYSRVSTYERGQLYAPLWSNPENQAIMQGLRAYLQDAAALVDQDDAGLRSQLSDFAELTRSQRAPVRRLLLNGVAQFAQTSDEARNDLSQTLIRLALSSLGLITVLILLALLLLRLLRQGRLVAAENERVQSRFAAMVTSSLDAIFVVDTTGRILEFNGAAEAVFQYRREEVLGGNMFDLVVPPHLRPEIAHNLQRFLTTGEKHLVDAGRQRLEAQRRSGEVFPVEVSVTAAKASEATVFVAFLRDITAQVQAEAELKRARDEARAGEKAKSELLTVMSHEMRTPLNGILGSLELMTRDPLSDRQQRNLRAAKLSGDLLLSHVNDVLDLSRLDAAPQKAAKLRFDLVELVDALVDGQAAAAKARGNMLNAAFLTEDVQHVTGDPAALNRCLVNLVGNAVKFTANGDILIEVERLHHSDQVEIRVSDTGEGIPEDKIDSIFQEFVTVDPSFGRRSEGTGLGLAITQRLVASMGGSISVDSIEGEGSLFQITVPLPAVAEPIEAPAPSLDQASDRAPLPARHILVVEDNEINRDILTDMLQDLGQSVDSAQDGPAGIDLAQQALATGGYDAILMDISMPGMDGIEALTRMRALGISQPALAVTAHASAQDHARVLAAGFLGIVTKPVSLDQLHRALDSLGRQDGDDARQAQVFETAAAQLGQQTRDDFVDRMGAEKFATLIRRFVRDAEGLLSELTHVEVLSDDQVQNAHNLAGMAGLLGAAEMQNALKMIEDLPQTATPEEAVVILPDLLAEARGSLATLEATPTR